MILVCTELDTKHFLQYDLTFENCEDQSYFLLSVELLSLAWPQIELYYLQIHYLILLGTGPIIHTASKTIPTPSGTNFHITWARWAT